MQKGFVGFHPLSSLCLLLALSSHTYANEAISQKQFLFEKLLINEMNYQDGLVEQTLKRLALIAPNDPVLIAAEIRLALRQGKPTLANELLAKLKESSPDYQLYRQSQINITLALPANQQKLSQARLFAIAGEYKKANTLYDELFHAQPPTPELSVEYWSLMSKIPDRQATAYHELKALYRYLTLHHLHLSDPDANNWQGTLLKVLSDLSLKRGELAFKKMQIASAETYFKEAIQFNPKNDYGYIGLGDVAFLRKHYAESEAFYRKAQETTWHGSAIYGILRIYKLQSLQKALNYLNNLPPDPKTQFKATIREVENELLQQEAERFFAQKNWSQALIKYKQAHEFDPTNVWLTYHLVSTMRELGQLEQAKTVLRQLAIKLPHDPDQAYVYAMFLSSINQDQDAVNRLLTIPKSNWDQSMRDLYDRLSLSLALDHAQKLWDAGNKQAAINYLQAQPAHVRINLKLAGWAFNDNRLSDALRYFRAALSMEPTNIDAIMGEIETYIAQGKLNEAEQVLTRHAPQTETGTINVQRRVAEAWTALTQPQKAFAIYSRLKRTIRSLTPSDDNALVFRNAARIEVLSNDPIEAKEDYREAMYQSRIAKIRPDNNQLYTRLTRITKGDDWIKRSIRQEAADLYLHQQTNVTIGNDFWELPGTPAYSGFRASESNIQIDTPLFNGRGIFRANYIIESAGQFTTINGSYIAPFGTCEAGCSSGIIQRKTGYGFDVGWYNNKWAVNMGHTPIGFNVPNWFGALSYTGDFHYVGWTLTAKRSMMTNSLLSFSGTVDPNTQTVWGGAMFNGVNLSLSYDRGESYGLWGNLDAGTVTGKNIPSNQRVRLMDGYYYKLINEDNRRLSIGISNMVWHYQKNLNGYTLGEAGYFSPQRYISFTLPVNYRQRTENWTYEVGASVSWSNSSIQSINLYPLPQLIPAFLNLQNTASTPSSANATGYALFALAERRLTSHLVLGGMFEIQRSVDYTPSHAAIYLRYFFHAWDGDMDLPIRPRYTMFTAD